MLKDEKWILPENLIKGETRERELVNSGKIDGRSHISAYYAYKLGIDKNSIKHHAILEDKTDRKYAAVLNLFLKKWNYKLEGNILDVGCGIGTVTNAIREYNPNGRTVGLDICKSAIDVAKERYDECEFYAQSADKLDNFENNYFDIMHSREFYPFTRTDDVDFHLRFLKHFHKKLKPNGVLVLQMVDLEKGFFNTFNKRKRELIDCGYGGFIKEVMFPLKLYGFTNSITYKMLNPLVTLGMVSAYPVFNKKINYFYLMKRIS